MKLNITDIKKRDNYLYITTKKPLFVNMDVYIDYLNKFFKSDGYLYSTKEGKYVESAFALRNNAEVDTKVDIKARIYFTEESDYLKLYKYVILVDKEHPYPTLVNDGRVETGVRRIYFESEPGCVPVLKIEK